MNLSYTLFNNLTNNLEINAYLLEKEQFYIKNLLKQINFFKKLEKENYKTFSTSEFSKVKAKKSIIQDLVVMYIIYISFLKANTTIHVSDTKGKIILFYSAGSVGLTGKQKKNRRTAIVLLISLLIKKASFLNKKPISVHLNNVNFYQNLIVNKLKQTFYIKIIRSFHQAPYNGCRKQKIRRKKHTKKFK